MKGRPVLLPRRPHERGDSQPFGLEPLINARPISSTAAAAVAAPFVRYKAATPRRVRRRWRRSEAPLAGWLSASNPPIHRLTVVISRDDILDRGHLLCYRPPMWESCNCPHRETALRTIAEEGPGQATISHWAAGRWGRWSNTSKNNVNGAVRGWRMEESLDM